VSIIGIQSLVYGVPNVEESRRFFEDFGLTPELAGTAHAQFSLAEGSTVILRHEEDTSLPPTSMTSNTSPPTSPLGIERQ